VIIHGLVCFGELLASFMGVEFAVNRPKND
jgi:hypothetical protein